MPTVSTIIPAYNAQKFIAHAVETALNQTGVDHEVIVVDDGSTDSTWQILESFGDRIRKMRQANAGLVRTRNRAAGIAAGEWLAFLDADDVWEPDKLAKQLAAADADTAIVYTDRLNFGDIGRWCQRQSDSVTLYEGDVFERLLLDNFVTVSSVLMRKSWFERLGGFTEELWGGADDWDLWLRCAAEGGKVRLCREPLTRCLCHNGSMQQNKHDRMCEERLKALRRALALPRGRAVSRTLACRALASAWECSANFAAPTARAKALRWYLRSLCCWPFRSRPYKGIVKCLLGRTG